MGSARTSYIFTHQNSTQLQQNLWSNNESCALQNTSGMPGGTRKTVIDHNKPVTEQIKSEKRDFSVSIDRKATMPVGQDGTSIIGNIFP